MNGKDVKASIIDIKEILVWDENPRFHLPFSNKFEIDYENDDFYIQKLIDQEYEQNEDDNEKLKYFKELIDSLLKYGFIVDNDQIFVKKANNGYYVVLEGNRRIAAMKICNYITEGKNNWIDFFIKKFGEDYYNDIKNMLIKKFEKIHCFEFLTSEVKIIKRKIYKRDQINQIGKKYWLRITRLIHVYEEYKILQESSNKESDEIYKELSELFDKSKSKIRKDLDSIKWLLACFKAANIESNIYKNYKVTPLELARNKIIDPTSNQNLSELLGLEYNEKNNTFEIKNNSRIKINFKKLAIFLCDGLEKGYYTRDGWRWEYIPKLMSFLYPNSMMQNEMLVWPLDEMKKIYKNPDKLNEFKKNKTDSEIATVRTILSDVDEISSSVNNLIEKINSLNEKREEYMKKNSNKKQFNENNSFVHFCAFIDFLYHEMVNQKMIKKSSMINFPFGRFALIFRNVFTMILNIIFIDDVTREKLLLKMENKSKELLKITIAKQNNDKNISFDELRDSDYTKPTQFVNEDAIGNSIFYGKQHKVCSFFTKLSSNKNDKEIIDIFFNELPSLFNDFYQRMCAKFDIEFNKIEKDKFNFFDTLSNKNPFHFYQKCNYFIHNIIYIVNNYNPETINNYAKNFSSFKNLLSLMESFIISL